MSNLANPYVGPRAYESYETLYGRDRELRQLVALVVAERIVLLHSPSGAGKTSLLQAGLIPHMRADDFHVLPVVRVNLDVPNRFTGKVENRYLFSTLLSLEEDVPEAHRLAPSDLPKLSLDAYLNRRYRPEGASTSELFVFDQFEEILTVLPSDRDGKQAFFEQLGTALRNRDRWAIFAMREDYVAALAPYLRPIPNRLSAAFRLDLLGREAAMQAIQKPAQQAGVDFTTPAAEKLVDDLSQVQEQTPDGRIESHAGLYVEPVQLQVVCYRLWDSQVTDDRVITVADLGQVGSVDDSLAGYYAQTVSRVTAMTGVGERAIREWFGNRLITPEGVRSQVLQRAGLSDGLDNRAIFQLVDAHILRAEKRAGSTWFELAHDRLIAPVRKSNAEWFAANLRLFQVQATLWDQHGRGDELLLRGKALAEARQEATIITLTTIEKDFFIACANVHAREIRDKRRNRAMTILAIVATIAMIVSVILGLISLESAKNLEVEKSNAEAARSAAEMGRVTAQAAQAVAETERARADQQTQDAISRKLKLQSQSLPEILGEQYPLKGLLAVEAARMNPDLDSIQTLSNFLNIPFRRVITLSHPDRVLSLAFSPDGKSLVSSDYAGNIHVWDTATGERKVEMRHDSAVNSVAFNPDGNWVVSGSDDKIARVWEAATGKLVVTIPHTDGVSIVAFSPDGKWVATNSGNTSDTVRVWEAATGKPVAELKHDGKVTAIAFSPDSSLIATGSNDYWARIWNIADQQVERELGLVKDVQVVGNWTINSVAFSPDKEDMKLASGGGDTTVQLWDPKKENDVNTMWGHGDVVNSVAFSPDGYRVVSGSDDGTARVWNTSSNGKVGVLNHDDGVLSAAFSPDGKWVVTSSRDNTVRVWDTITYKQVAGLLNQDVVTSVAFSPDSRWIASGSNDHTVQLWEAVTDEVLQWNGHDADALSMAFSPDGSQVVTGGGGGFIQVWDIASGRVLWDKCYACSFGQRVNNFIEFKSVAFSPDGRWVAAGMWAGKENGDHTVMVWDAVTGTPKASMHHGDAISAVAFSPDSRFVISGSFDEKVRVWDFTSGEDVPIGWTNDGVLINVAAGNEVVSMDQRSEVRTIAVSPDGSRVVAGSEDGMIRVWETKSGEEVMSMSTGSPVAVVAISPDGRRIAAGGWGMIAQVWNVETGQEPASMDHRGVVFSLAFSPDNSRVVSGSEDGMVKVWDANTSEPIAEMSHKNDVKSVAFSPDGQWVVSGSKDGTARVWEARSGKEVISIQHDRPVLSVAFSPDGRQVASLDGNSPIKLSLFQPDDLKNAACSRLTRNLTETEWDQYIGGIFKNQPTCPDLPEGGK